MADKKISALTSATLPLAGTEVLPIVQSSTTVKVAVNDLTVKNIRSNATTGLLQIAGPVNASTRVMTTPDANFTVARTDAAQSFTGTQSFSENILVNGTFPSTPHSLMTQVRAGLTGNYAAQNSAGLGIAGTSVLDNAYVKNSTGDFAYLTSAKASRVLARAGEIYFQRSTGTDVADTSTNFTSTGYIDTSGIFTMTAYGAGAATFSASGVISSVSDETWKIKDGVPVNTDEMLQKLEPGYWFYNDEKKETFGTDRQLGFYAQNVHFAIGKEAAPVPEKVKDKDGNDTDVSKPWGYYDRSVLAVVVVSLKNALSTIEELKQRIEVLENK